MLALLVLPQLCYIAILNIVYASVGVCRPGLIPGPHATICPHFFSRVSPWDCLQYGPALRVFFQLCFILLCCSPHWNPNLLNIKIHGMSTSPRNVFNEEDIALFGHRLACVCFCVCVCVPFTVQPALERCQNMNTYIHLGRSLHGMAERKSKGRTLDEKRSLKL